MTKFRLPFFEDPVRRVFHFFTLGILIQALASCVAMPRPQPEVASAPIFDPIVFFSGRTQGRGTLKKILSSPVPIIVNGRGTINEDGVFVLNQEVQEDEKQPRNRSWRIHRIDHNSYGGSLSDASGPVKISSEGNRIHISFTMDGGFPVDQYIYLAADGQSAKNIMVVSKLGVRVAVLEEKITKIPK